MSDNSRTPPPDPKRARMATKESGGQKTNEESMLKEIVQQKELMGAQKEQIGALNTHDVLDGAQRQKKACTKLVGSHRWGPVG